jgi:hypothetical protein
VVQQEADEFARRVACAADDADSNHVLTRVDKS